MTDNPTGNPAERAAQPSGQPLLEMREVVMRFGGVTAINKLDLTLREGEIFALIGPNGAGKTTVFNVITGVYRPTEGRVDFGSNFLVGAWKRDRFPRLGRGDGIGALAHWAATRFQRDPNKKRYQVTKAGVARTFQNIRLFHNMSAIENVMVGADAHHRTGLAGAGLGLPWHRNEERDGRAEAQRLLDFVGIAHRGHEAAKNLPYGDQRRLEIARALATRPRLLLLDEPAAGMNPAEKVALQDLIRKIRDTGVTVLLIEHDMRLVMGISDRVAVLDFGTKIAEGLPREVQDDPRVIEAYLGAPADAS